MPPPAAMAAIEAMAGMGNGVEAAAGAAGAAGAAVAAGAASGSASKMLRVACERRASCAPLRGDPASHAAWLGLGLG